MFVSSYHDRQRGVIQVWERDEQGKRHYRKHKVSDYYYFYTEDKLGNYESLTGQKLKKVVCQSFDDFKDEIASIKGREGRVYESDFYPLEKCMMDVYFGQPTPKLVVGFIDIEVDYQPGIFPRPVNPYAPINAITIYRTDIESYFTLTVPSEEYKGTVETANADLNLDSSYSFYSNERELLTAFIDFIDDVDVLSGWNSDFFDMPYIAKRMELLWGEAGLKKLALEYGPLPYWGERERFKGSKEKEIVVELVSRVHLDYMRLFKKFNLEGRQSHTLAAIMDDELEIPKLHYPGTLYQLYRNDLKHFCEYNRRDVEGIVKLDEKFHYIELANKMVHEATVNFSSIFGSVQLIDTAITNFAHSVRHQIVSDRQHLQKEEVEGALVLTPRIGLHKWIASCDINSLYPSVYRSLNLSPEKIVGQLMEYEAGWHAVYLARKNPGNDLYMQKEITLRFEGAGSDDDLKVTVEELIEILVARNLAISAYGTILDQGNGEGLLPAVLSYWFKGRKELQAKKKDHGKKADAILKANGSNKEDPAFKEEKKQEEYYDMLQGVRKVLLNSSYGATLNEWCRFHDPRLGASTTGCGRQISTFMINNIAKGLIGDNSPTIVKEVKHTIKKGVEKIENEYTIACPPNLGPIYGDTDSCYFVMDDLVSDLDSAVACADAIVDQINEAFPAFMKEAFMCQPDFSDLIRANREIVAWSGILRAKKKYMMYVADLEGRKIDRDDPKALKTMGSDIKLSSTPEAIRELLKDVTMSILKGVEKPVIDDKIMVFRRNLHNNPDINPLEYATVSSVKTLEASYFKWERIEHAGMGKVKLHSNARATINHNHYIKTIGEKETQPINDGQKIKIVWLKDNELGFTNIAFSSETDELPPWFLKAFEIDVKLTELKLIDQKIKNIFDPCGWSVPTEHTVVVGKLLEF